MKRYLFIVDPQNDFIEGGSLPVTGGTKALREILESGILDKEWEKIYVTLDTHYPQNLAFGEPKTELLRELYKDIRVTPWPPHCIKDTYGWEIYEPLMKALMEKNNVEYLMKGEDDTKEAYSVFNFGDSSEDPRYSEILQSLIPADEIWVTGLAEDYCVLETIKSILDYTSGKVYLPENMTAAISPRDKTQELYKDLRVIRV